MLLVAGGVPSMPATGVGRVLAVIATLVTVRIRARGCREVVCRVGVVGVVTPPPPFVPAVVPSLVRRLPPSLVAAVLRGVPVVRFLVVLPPVMSMLRLVVSTPLSNMV
jgi:hypothetical protein